MKRLILCLLVGCLPIPPDPAPLPDTRPFIVRPDVVPAPDRVLTELRGQLIVPVELVDPSVTIEWRLFVDYDPTGAATNPNDPEGLAGRIGRGVVRPEGTEQTRRDIRIGLDRVVEQFALSKARCHVVEVVVARAFLGTRFRDGHTPAPPGGDVVSWFFSPDGTLEGCPTGSVTPQPIDGGVE